LLYAGLHKINVLHYCVFRTFPHQKVIALQIEAILVTHCIDQRPH